MQGCVVIKVLNVASVHTLRTDVAVDCATIIRKVVATLCRDQLRLRCPQLVDLAQDDSVAS